MDGPPGASESSAAQAALAENAHSIRDDDQYLVHRARLQFVLFVLTLAYLEQYMVIGWIIMLPTTLVAFWLFVKFRQHR